MSLHIIFGDYGAGKSALMAALLEQIYKHNGRKILQRCKEIIDEENSTRYKKLRYPKKVPIYTANFDVTFTTAAGQYKPYKISGKDIGLNIEGKKHKSLYPGSVLVVDEAQNEFNSKENLERAVSAFFEKHRHDEMDIWLLAQRGILINKDIRGLCTHCIEVKSREHEYTIFRTIYKTTWHCREFTEQKSFEEYLDTDGASTGYKETTYVHNGNVFKLFNSRACRSEFMPPEGGKFAC